MLSADDINAILNQPAHEYGGLSEHDEREIEAVAKRVLDAVGPEEFRTLIARQALPYEAMLRATESPDHPALRMIDELRRLGRIE